MISHISGTIIAREGTSIILQMGAISFELFAPNASSLEIGQTHTLQVYLHWNQEQGPSLFGFQTLQEKKIFMLIIECPGIGPKIAMAILEHLTADGFITAVASEDQKALSGVSGIGPRKAEQIIVQLKHKVQKMMDHGLIMPEGHDGKQRQGVQAALSSLNYSRGEIAQVMQFLAAQKPGLQAPFDQVLRQALSFLAKHVSG